MYRECWCTCARNDFDWPLDSQRVRCYWLTDSQTNRSCLHSILNIAGVFVIYSCIYVHINFVSQIFR